MHGRTDILIANAALQYVLWPETFLHDYGQTGIEDKITVPD